MKTFNFLYIAATALLLAACANESEGVDNNSPVAATVVADISQAVTRATVGNTWSANDAIGVYTTSTGYTYGNNVKYTYSADGKFESSSPIYFADAKQTTEFSAYYPYQENVDGNGVASNWQMAAVEDDKPCLADFLFASGATASKSSPEVKFTGDHNFKHKMSMIRLTFVAGDGISAYSAYLQNNLKLKNIYTTGEVNTKTGEVTVSGNRANYEYDVNDKSLEDDVTCEFIVFPQALDNNKVDIELQVGAYGTINTYTASLPSSTNNEFKEGYLYTYKIRINNTRIDIEAADIEKWQTYDEGPLDAEQE